MASGMRLRRIRFKDGRTIDVLRPKKTDDTVLRERFAVATKYAMEPTEHPLAGYALVVWQTDGTSTAFLQSDGKIPSILVPDFVRNRLLAMRIEDWTIETINDQRGPV